MTSNAEPPVIFLDLDSCLLSTHPGRYGPELALQADIPEAIDRLAETADSIVILVDPPTSETPHALGTAQRLEVLRKGLGAGVERLILAVCPHGEKGACQCGKPGTGLIEHALLEHGLSARNGWYIGADQAGVVSGRNAGLSTIRIGPLGEDHLSAVHRPDYEARDLLDAANHIMFEVLAA